MKISVVGCGYVGLSLGLVLSKKNKICFYDINEKITSNINKRISHLSEKDIKKKLKSNINIEAKNNFYDAVDCKDFIIIATPTDYNPNTNNFDTSSVEMTIKKLSDINNKAIIIIKSTIPLGYTEYLRQKYSSKRIIFSPEFLREGKSIQDNLNPDRIVIGDKGINGKKFSKLLLSCTEKRNVPVIYTNSTEAESIKLFSNTYLAMRIAFFNELDSYCERNEISTKNVIEGVSLDKRVGDHYNNPSFGYGGYCLPKDTKQLLKNYDKVPNNLISAIVEANTTRKNFIADNLIARKPNVIGVFRITMKHGSDNFRTSAVQGIMKRIKAKGIKIVIYEPLLKQKTFFNSKVITSLSKFKNMSDIIITNRYEKILSNVNEKVYTRDIFLRD